MALTAQEVFTETVRALPPGEQLRLAALILQELVQSGVTDTLNTIYGEIRAQLDPVLHSVQTRSLPKDDWT